VEETGNWIAVSLIETMLSSVAGYQADRAAVMVTALDVCGATVRPWFARKQRARIVLTETRRRSSYI